MTKADQQELISRVSYAMSGLYVDLNQVGTRRQKMTSRRCWKRAPDNPGYNNDLGYIWADHDMNLAEWRS